MVPSRGVHAPAHRQSSWGLFYALALLLVSAQGFLLPPAGKVSLPVSDRAPRPRSDDPSYPGRVDAKAFMSSRAYTAVEAASCGAIKGPGTDFDKKLYSAQPHSHHGCTGPSTVRSGQASKGSRHRAGVGVWDFIDRNSMYMLSLVVGASSLEAEYRPGSVA